jgi:hypothetical protein
VFHANHSRMFALDCFPGCIKRVMAIPESFRASISYVSQHWLVSDTDFSHSEVRLRSRPGWSTSSEYEHTCCRTCDDCDTCDRCKMLAPADRPPHLLRDVLALFPNTIDILLDWESTTHESYYQLEPIHTGGQLQLLKRLEIMIGAVEGGETFGTSQARDAQRIIDHFHMPSLERIDITFWDSDDGEGFLNDFPAIRDALCRIASTKLQYVNVSTTMPRGSENTLDVWVSWQSITTENRSWQICSNALRDSPSLKIRS